MVGPSLYGRLVGHRPAIRPCVHIPGPLDPNRLAPCCCTLQGGREGPGGGVNDGLPARCPSFSNSVIMLRCTSCYSGTTIGSSYSTAQDGTRKSGLMLYHLPWIARNFHIHRVISLSPVSRGYNPPSRHQIRLQKHENQPWTATEIDCQSSSTPGTSAPVVHPTRNPPKH